MNSVKDQVKYQVWDQLGDRSLAQIRNKFTVLVGNQIWVQITMRIRDQILIQIRNKLYELR